MVEEIADSEVLLNRSELDRMLQKTRLEGAIGHITFLCEAFDKRKIRTLGELEQTIRDDWCSASGAIGALMMETLRFDGFANGLMDNIKPDEKQDSKDNSTSN